MSVDYLDLADFLAISELVLTQPAEDIARISRLELAESALHAPAASFGGVEFYPDLAVKAAVLCTRIVKNHPLPDGNKRVGFVCMIEFCLRNGLTWTPPPGDEDGEASARVILELAAGPGDEEAVTALAEWIRERTGS
ncbi:MAG: Fic family protein [Actinomycetota bacterium]